MAERIENDCDTIELSDLRARVLILEGQRDDHDDGTLSSADEEELIQLRHLLVAASHYGSEQSATFIRDRHLEDYARQLADDLHDADGDGGLNWPFNHVDWASAAAELRQDYTEVDFDGVSYWIRS